MKSIFFYLSVFIFSRTSSFNAKRSPTKAGQKTQISMIMAGHDTALYTQELFLNAPVWAQLAAQGISDAVATVGPVQCPAFGEPGWAPFCFLNGNPVFNAFDSFQLSIQGLVVSLHDFLTNLGLKNAYGPSIILFTMLVRLAVLPLTFQQLLSSQRTQALSPKIQEIRSKFPNDQNLQNQMIALLYQETQVNPLAGCLPAIVQIPVFIALYRSFQNLAAQDRLSEAFLWLPDLEGPVYGTKSSAWLLGGWANGVPPLGWENTIAFASIPLLLILAQTVSLQVLSPPSDDPAVQRSQRILKFLPLMLGYFSLSVPAGLGVYWITNNVLSTVTTAGIKEYFKRNPSSVINVDLDKLANSRSGAYSNPAWGYTSPTQMVEEAKLNLKPARAPRIPADFV